MGQIKRLKDAFPQLQQGFFDVLIERIKELKIPDERLKDSVDNLINNFKYPTLRIADIISWDKRVKLLTYGDMLSIHQETGRAFEDYVCIPVNGKKFWISNADHELIKDKI